MNASNTRVSMAELLRDPDACLGHACDDARTGGLTAFLLLLSLAGSAAFGFAIGSFADWGVAFLDAAKMAGIMLFSFALCYPTLYVFSVLGGCKLSPKRLLALGLVPIHCRKRAPIYFCFFLNKWRCILRSGLCCVRRRGASSFRSWGCGYGSSCSSSWRCSL